MQANETRFVTKIRWIIEDINGIIKQHFRGFDGTIQNSMLIHIMDDFKIACAFINCFFNRKLSDVENSKEIAEEMKKKVDEKNELDKYLKKPSKKLFEKIDSVELTDFPKLSVEFIRKKITFGWYQISQALSYLAEHFDKNGDIEIRIEKSTCDKTDISRLIFRFFAYVANCFFSSDVVLVFVGGIFFKKNIFLNKITPEEAKRPKTFE